MNRKEVTDLPFIGALMLKGHRPLETYKQGTRIVFVFEWNDAMQELENKFFSIEGLEGNLREHHRIVRELKKHYIYSRE